MSLYATILPMGFCGNVQNIYAQELALLDELSKERSVSVAE